MDRSRACDPATPQGLMLIGAMVWAYIIGQACSVLANLDLHESRCAGEERKPKTRIFRRIFTQNTASTDSHSRRSLRSLLECSCFAFLVARCARSSKCDSRSLLGRYGPGSSAASPSGSRRSGTWAPTRSSRSERGQSDEDGEARAFEARAQRATRMRVR